MRMSSLNVVLQKKKNNLLNVFLPATKKSVVFVKSASKALSSYMKAKRVRGYVLQQVEKNLSCSRTISKTTHLSHSSTSITKSFPKASSTTHSSHSHSRKDSTNAIPFADHKKTHSCFSHARTNRQSDDRIDDDDLLSDRAKYKDG